VTCCILKILTFNQVINLLPDEKTDSDIDSTSDNDSDDSSDSEAELHTNFNMFFMTSETR
jgi:hypothetical protein